MKILAERMKKDGKNRPQPLSQQPLQFPCPLLTLRPLAQRLRQQFPVDAATTLTSGYLLGFPDLLELQDPVNYYNLPIRIFNVFSFSTFIITCDTIKGVTSKPLGKICIKQDSSGNKLLMRSQDRPRGNSNEGSSNSGEIKEKVKREFQGEISGEVKGKGLKRDQKGYHKRNSWKNRDHQEDGSCREKVLGVHLWLLDPLCKQLYFVFYF